MSGNINLHFAVIPYGKLVWFKRPVFAGNQFQGFDDFGGGDAESEKVCVTPRKGSGFVKSLFYDISINYNSYINYNNCDFLPQFYDIILSSLQASRNSFSVSL